MENTYFDSSTSTYKTGTLQGWQYWERVLPMYSTEWKSHRDPGNFSGDIAVTSSIFARVSKAPSRKHTGNFPLSAAEPQIHNQEVCG